jgi:hypothetical protein
MFFQTNDSGAGRPPPADKIVYNDQVETLGLNPTPSFGAQNIPNSPYLRAIGDRSDKYASTTIFPCALPSRLLKL